MSRLACLLVLITLCIAAAGQTSAPQTVQLPSERPSGSPVVDRIWFTYYPASRTPAPAVVIAHSLAEGRRSFLHRRLHRMAARFAMRGIAAAVMELPYHMRRLPRGVSNLRLYTGSSIQTANAFDQAASDVSTVSKWLRGRPEIDPDKVGVVGLSLGAIITHLAMGRDARLSAGVAILGGADLERMRKSSVLTSIFHPRLPELSAEEMDALKAIDPLTVASSNLPRRVLMIQAARDTIVPPSGAVKLWNALGNPPIRWVDSNHFGLFFGAESVARAAESYLLQVWNGTPPGDERIPRIYAPTLKIGILSGLDSRFTPALQWQAIPLGARDDHMALAHINLGMSGRGPFAALSLTVNQGMDIGIARRLNGDGIRPILSFHLVF